MSRARVKPKKTAKCPLCGRVVVVTKKRRLAPHFQSGRVRCPFLIKI